MTTDKNNSLVTALMWWDGGDRAITAREKATIEEHGPSCYTVPLVPAQAVDPADPWRGLYLPARMPTPSEYGDLTHPDIPLWPDDRDDALDKLVHAQGFDFHIVAGDFTEAAMEDGDELYWREMRAWNPEAPEGDWRLAWKGDTEDGPYAWFVRPMALRPEPTTPPAQGIDLGPLRRLYQAYVRLLESGRDRILDFGGTCDPVDVMERTDVHLIEARNLLGIKRDAARGVGNG